MADYPHLQTIVLDATDVRALAEFYRKLLGLQYLPRVTWPDASGVAQQLHLDLSVPDRESLEIQRERALDLGAEQLLDRADDPEESFYVFADPAGHPFCILVAVAPHSIPPRRPGRAAARRITGSSSR